MKEKAKLLPLEGVRIVDLTIGQQGPHATVMLSDMGADVIKVEPREGDHARGLAGKPESGDPGHLINRQSYLWSHDRNKKSIAIDLKKERGRKIVLKLVEEADVFVYNFRPGVIERLGLDFLTVSKVNPRIIYAIGSGLGLKGPHAQRATNDLVAQAMCGIMYQTGMPDSPPMPVGAAIADQTGSFLLAYGILVALFARERTGIGQQVDVSLLGTQMCLQSWEINYYLASGKLPPRAGRGLGLIGGVWGIYKTKDRWIALGGIWQRRWPEFCSALGIESLRDDPRFATGDDRVAHADELVSILDEVFLTRPAQEWIEVLARAEQRSGPVNTYAELVSDPQVVENEYVVEVDWPGHGVTKVVGIPVKLSRTPGEIRGPYPEIGEHTHDILMEAGYSWEEIAQLTADEVI